LLSQTSDRRWIGRHLLGEKHLVAYDIIFIDRSHVVNYGSKVQNGSISKSFPVAAKISLPNPARADSREHGFSLSMTGQAFVRFAGSTHRFS
jgi:hypothetical protein